MPFLIIAATYFIVIISVYAIKIDKIILSKKKNINSNFLGNNKYQLIRALIILLFFSVLITILSFIFKLNAEEILYCYLILIVPVAIFFYGVLMTIANTQNKSGMHELSSYYSKGYKSSNEYLKYRKKMYYSKKEAIKEKIYLRKYIPLVSLIINIENQDIEDKKNFFIERNYDVFFNSTLENLFAVEYDFKTEIDKFKNGSTKIKVKILDLLFRMATYDGSFCDDEEDFLKKVSSNFRLPNSLYKKIKARYITEREEFEESYNFYQTFTEPIEQKLYLLEAYKILGLEENSPMEAVKENYRKLAKKHHPDMVAYLGEEYMKKAEKVFLKIQSAFETIEKENL